MNECAVGRRIDYSPTLEERQVKERKGDILSGFYSPDLGSGGGGPGVALGVSNADLNGVNGFMSNPGAAPDGGSAVSTPFALGAPLSRLGTSSLFRRDSRASSSCVSLMYSTGGRGMSGGGAN